jgi:hypothetical protein
MARAVPSKEQGRVVVEKDVILTQTGYEKLKETIDELETVKRR